MSEVTMATLLQQIRTMSEAANGNQSIVPPTESTDNFSNILKNAVDGVNEMQQASGNMKTSFEMGEPGVDLTQVMVASQKANVSFQAMVEVRNKLVTAYQDIMNMPI